MDGQKPDVDEPLTDQPDVREDVTMTTLEQLENEAAPISQPEPEAPPMALLNGGIEPPRKRGRPRGAKATNGGKPQVKRAKAQRNGANSTTLDQFGFRKGSAKSKAAALYARGATLHEVADKVGRIMFNMLNELEGKGFRIKKEPTLNKKTGREVTRYRLMSR